MHVSYGSYNHQPGEVSIAIGKTNRRTEAATVIAQIVRWDMNGQLVNPTGDPAEMSRKIASLKAAYAYDGQDLKLIMPDGSTDSEHALLQNEAIGLVRVIEPPSFPTNQGAVYITHCPYKIVVEAEIPLGDPETLLLSFTESLSFSGGGPRFGHLEPLVGRPVKQLLRRNTIYRVTQSGSAVGYRTYPIVPRPIWPAALIANPEVTRQAPKRTGWDFVEFSTNWSYQFESSFPLAGDPTPWI